MSAELLLSELKANEVAIEQKKAEIDAYLSEKQQVTKDISNLLNVVIPAQESKVNQINILVKAEYEAYNKRVENAKTSVNKKIETAKGLVRSAYSTKESKKGIYNKYYAEYSKWNGWYKDGCKWTGNAYGWQGSYCGDFAVGCRKTSHDFNKIAPNSCLKADRRKQRESHAKQKAITFNALQSRAKVDYDNAVKTWNNAKANVLKEENSNAVEKARQNRGNIVAQEKAYQDAKNILKNYIAPNGDKDRLTKKIDVIDNNVSIKNTELKNLENERTVTEVAYQEKLALINQQNAIIEEKEREAQAKRDQAKLITEGSVQNALNQNANTGVTSGSNLPTMNLGMGSLGAPKQSSVPMILIGLIALGVGYKVFIAKK